VAAKREQADSLTLTELEQVRVLADPLRMRVVEVLCRGERTTKQVAEELGEKPTKLYHHVEALEKVGIVRQTRTRRNRGTLERYYVAVARSFRADPRLFGGGGSPKSAAMQSMVSALLGSTAQELERLAASAGAESGLGEEAVLSYLAIDADPATIDRLKRRLLRLLADIQKLGDDSTSRRGSRRYRLTLAFFPLDRFDDAGSK
jgi:DNA-binding transcriptional ArsR family regulator